MLLPCLSSFNSMPTHHCRNLSPSSLHARFHSSHLTAYGLNCKKKLGLHGIWLFQSRGRIWDCRSGRGRSRMFLNWSSYIQRSFAIVYIYKWKRGCGYDPHARDAIERCKLPNLLNNEFLPNYTVRQMHRKMVKSDLISGWIWPDIKTWPDFGRGQIWYPVQPQKEPKKQISEPITEYSACQ